jgi:hypothetical protein
MSCKRIIKDLQIFPDVNAHLSGKIFSERLQKKNYRKKRFLIKSPLGKTRCRKGRPRGGSIPDIIFKKPPLPRRAPERP